MADVKWIKMMVGMFDGMSFKKIKKAKIGGESFRDKLTAVWFELMDFAGRCNHNGAFISPREIPFTDLADIAVMIDRDEEELRLCMSFFINEGMISVTNDIYSLTTWAEYQNQEGLDKIREQNRQRKRLQREREKQALPEYVSRDSHVTVTQCHATEEDKEEEGEEEGDIIYTEKSQQVKDLFCALCKSFPSVRTLSAKRIETITESLQIYTLDDFKTVFESAENSSFLKGEDGGWKATFDWLIDKDNMLKVLEGNYTDRPKKTGKKGSRKEIVPDWCEKSSLDVEEYENAVVKYRPVFKQTTGNNPDLADRVEKLKKKIQGE